MQLELCTFLSGKMLEGLLAVPSATTVAWPEQIRLIFILYLPDVRFCSPRTSPLLKSAVTRTVRRLPPDCHAPIQGLR
jgi:hypothetical protein